MGKVLLFLALALLTACAMTEGDGSPVDITAVQPIQVESPVRAYMVDGTSVVFEDGLTVRDDIVSGQGVLYDQNGDEMGPLTGFPLEDVAAMESYRDYSEVTDAMATAAGVVLGGALLAAVAGALAIALFGSCPTVYSVAADVPVLEAELFSYSIAPAFQVRDVDWLGVAPDEDWRVALEIRNEMLETHYIDQLELLEVTHQSDVQAYPGRNGEPVIVKNLVGPVTASDGNGGNILPDIEAQDTKVWSATDERLARVTENDYMDHLYLEFEIPDGTNDPAIVLRMRNSLLNTELFYGVMLENQGFGALDWMAKDLDRMTTAVRTGLWYKSTMGLTIEVWDKGRYREAGHIPDQGPVAWSERALRLTDVDPVDGKLKVRLSFVADNWRFDQIALALESEKGRTRVVPVERAETQEGVREDLPTYLAKADENYLITRPTDFVRVQFNVGEPEVGMERTFFLASDGYYTEWMRADWLTSESHTKFEPGTASLLQAIRQYAAKRDDYRKKFESTRIEIR